MYTEIESYKNFQVKIEHIIKNFDDQISEIYEIDREIGKLLSIIKKQNIPGITLMEQSYYATMLSIMSNVKANRANYLSLRAKLESLVKYYTITCYS